jgi:hypothetical protein
MGDMPLTVVIRSVPGLSARCGTRLARTGRLGGQGEGRLAMVPRRRRGTIM